MDVQKELDQLQAEQKRLDVAVRETLESLDTTDDRARAAELSIKLRTLEDARKKNEMTQATLSTPARANSNVVLGVAILAGVILAGVILAVVLVVLL